MSYNDKKFGNLFPTRQGTAIGGANERQMLDQVGGSVGYRKNFRIEPDGTTTMLTTKNGQPQFQNLGGGGDDDQINGTAGLDSGALLTTLHGPVKYTRSGKVTTTVGPGAKARFIHQITKKDYIGTSPRDNDTETFSAGLNPEIVKKCPPSLFTGKTRLYVQCLYGALESIEGGLTLNSSGLSIPTLTVNGVIIDTSCGVLYDAATSTHYLLSVTTGLAHRLSVKKSAKWLVPLLKDVTISAADKAKIEAYILAASVPSGVGQNMDLPPRIAGGMGYGWHFNWIGTAADCVGLSSAISSIDGLACYESEHFRISFTISEAGFVRGLLSTISKGKWRNKRDYQVICHPIWDLSGFLKLGFKAYDSQGSATIYAHYAHSTAEFPGSSELVLTTFNAVVAAPKLPGESRSPAYMNPGAPWVHGDDAVDYKIWNSHTQFIVTVTSGNGKAETAGFFRDESCKTASVCVSDDIDIGTHSWYKSDVPFAASGSPPYMGADGPLTPVPDPSKLSLVGGYYFEGELKLVLGGLGYTAGGGIPSGTALYSNSSTEYLYSATLRTLATWRGEYYGRANTSGGKLIWFPMFMDAEATYCWSQRTDVATESGDYYDMHGYGPEYAYAVGGEVGPPNRVVAKVRGYYEPLAFGFATGSFSRNVTSVYAPIEIAIFGKDAVTPESLLDPSTFLSSTRDVADTFVEAISSVGKSLYSATLKINVMNAPAEFAGKWGVYIGWA